MKPEKRREEEEEVRALLQRAFPAADTELGRDLWPAMLRRMEQHDAAVPLYDWVLGGCLVAAFVFFPKVVLLFAYHL